MLSEIESLASRTSSAALQLRFAQNDTMRALERFIVPPCIGLVGVMLCIVPVQTIDAGPPKAILVFGDSLSDGFMLQRSQAYPALLAKKLHAVGLNFQVTNASAA